MDHCIVCLESNDDLSSRIYKLSKEWHSNNVQRIIEKYLWWWCAKDGNNQNHKRWICLECWEQLKEFHDFFSKVKTQHDLQIKNLINNAAESNEHKVLEASVPKKLELLVAEDVEYLLSPAQSLSEDNSELADVEYIIYEDDIEDNNYMEIQNSQIEVVEYSLVQEPTSNCMESVEKNISEQQHGDSDFKDEWLELINETKCEEIVEEVPTENCNKNTKASSCARYSIKQIQSNTKIKQRFAPPLHDNNNTGIKEILKVPNQEFTCHLCSVVQRNFSVLKNHFRTEHKTRGYVFCCNKKFYERNELVDHLNVHANPDYFKCSKCSRVLANRTCYKKHLKGHEQTDERPRNFICETCGKAFLLRSHCKNHMLSHLPEDMKTFACDQCDKRYAAENFLKHHINIAHLNKYARVCDLCGETLRDRLAFERHKEEHEKGAIKIPCELCGVELKSELLLRRHIKFRHTAEYAQPHKCPHCDKISASRSALNVHIHYNHKGRRHVCKLCKKDFKLPKELRQHLAVIHGQVFYACSSCPRTFASSRNLAAHRMKSHSKNYETNPVEKQPPILLQEIIEYEVDVETTEIVN